MEATRGQILSLVSKKKEKYYGHDLLAFMANQHCANITKLANFNVFVVSRDIREKFKFELHYILTYTIS